MKIEYNIEYNIIIPCECGRVHFIDYDDINNSISKDEQFIILCEKCETIHIIKGDHSMYPVADNDLQCYSVKPECHENNGYSDLYKKSNMISRGFPVYMGDNDQIADVYLGFNNSFMTGNGSKENPYSIAINMSKMKETLDPVKYKHFRNARFNNININDTISIGEEISSDVESMPKLQEMDEMDSSSDNNFICYINGKFDVPLSLKFLDETNNAKLTVQNNTNKNGRAYSFSTVRKAFENVFETEDMKVSQSEYDIVFVKNGTNTIETITESIKLLGEDGQSKVTMFPNNNGIVIAPLKICGEVDICDIIDRVLSIPEDLYFEVKSVLLFLEDEKRTINVLLS